MSFNLPELEAYIRKILSSPCTDLSTISARGVRLKLTEVVPWLKPEVAKKRKQEIDCVITEVYQSICADSAAEAEEAASGEEAEDTRKRKQESDEENPGQGDEDEGHDDARPPKKAKKVKYDEDGKTKAKKARGSANGAAKKPGRPRKSAATVESGGESDGEGGRKKRGKKKSTGEGGGARGGFSKEFTLR